MTRNWLALPKERRQEISRRQNAVTAAYRRDWSLRRRYGITQGRFEAMFEAQCGLCAICGDREARQVDHDHATGAVRALLCGPCNKQLGILEDAAWCALATRYLDEYR